MKRLSWSKLFTLAALVSLGLAANIASAAVPDRIPAPYPTTNPLATSATPRAEFEGPSQSDFFNGNSSLGTASPVGSAQIAVGPEDILLVANNTIWRLPNGNAAGVVPTGLYPGAQLIGGQAFGAQRVFLDNWIGTAALAQLCPSTAQNPTACQFDNATVVYDQMQGRFLVLFTVVDTGITLTNTGAAQLTRPRKASWVLIVSRFATLIDQACFQGTSGGSGCPGVNVAGTDAFITPTPPSGNTGGINTTLWGIIYGNSVGTQSDSGNTGFDGFGSHVQAADVKTATSVGAGNINALPAFTTGAINGSNAFDCSAGAVYATQTVGSSVCYFPTSARLGVDNDTVTIASAVVNTNINGADLSLFYNPSTGGDQTFPGFAGTRIRVIKKTALYIAIFSPQRPLVAGNQFATSGPTRVLGDYYDLFSSPTNDGQPVDNTTGPAAGPPMPFTALASNQPCLTSDDSAFQGFLGDVTRCAPIFYEPAHLRGRAMASFSNLPIGLGAAGTQSSQTYLVGAISYDGFPSSTRLYVQGVREMYGFGSTPTNSFGPIPFYPVLQNGNLLDANFGQGFPSLVPVNLYNNPLPVTQQTYTGGANAPQLFVGDARPHAVIFREGHLYDARVINSNFPLQGQFPAGNPLSTTVAYEIVQKLAAATTGSTVYQDKWQNQTAFAPMFDVPANVALWGVGNPINGLPFLEKLFVGTTYPPLAGLPDTSYNSAPAGTPPALISEGDFVGGDPRSRVTFGSSGIASTQLGQIANCYSSALSPTVGTVTLSWVSLFDTRCGQDAYDYNPVIRDPRSGSLTATYALAIRGGEALDPNDGSLWNFGAYSQRRDAGVASNAHWGTFAANYKLSFPTTDAYGNATILFPDIVGQSDQIFMQMAVNLGFTPALSVPTGTNFTPTSSCGVAALPSVPAVPANTGCIPFGGVNPTLYGSAVGAFPIPAGVTPPGNPPAAGTFGANDAVTRREMAFWIIRAQMDEAAITTFLTNSAALNGTLGLTGASFADVPSTDVGFRYVEVMARRGYTHGCAASDLATNYCPDWISTRRDLAAFVIRAKMSNIFASLVNGCGFGFTNGTTTPISSLFPPAFTITCSPTGDNFGLFITGLTYFSDNPQVNGNVWYAYIQKLRELRITNGTSLGAANDGRNGTFALGTVNGPPPVGDPGQLTRRQLAAFIMRGFFF
jgi:hypothetical protein